MLYHFREQFLSILCGLGIHLDVLVYKRIGYLKARCLRCGCEGSNDYADGGVKWDR